MDMSEYTVSGEVQGITRALDPLLHPDYLRDLLRRLEGQADDAGVLVRVDTVRVLAEKALGSPPGDDTLRAAAQAVVDATANWHLPTTVGGARLSDALIALRSALAASATDEQVHDLPGIRIIGKRIAASATDEPVIDIEAEDSEHTEDWLDGYEAGWSDSRKSSALAASATERQHCPCCDGTCT